MRSNLPRYESKIALRLIIKFFICVLFFALACYLYISTMDIIEPTRENKIYAIIILAVAWVISSFCIGFWQLLFDRDWQGTVVSKNLRHGYVVAHTIGRGRMIPTVWIDLVVRRDSGRMKKITYNVRETSAKYYGAGDRVLHLKGSKFLLRPDRRDDEIICPLCANTLAKEECHHCRIRFSTKKKFY